MKCEDCKDCDRCWCTVDVDTYPDGSHPCKYCNSKENLYMEFPKKGDWKTGKFVVRMGCLCDECDKDLELTYKWRTEFGEMTGLVEEWNGMNEEILVPTFELNEGSETTLTDIKNKLHEDGKI
jgi:hypothetical protein